MCIGLGNSFFNGEKKNQRNACAQMLFGKVRTSETVNWLSVDTEHGEQSRKSCDGGEEILIVYIFPHPSHS